ncbi:MAG: 3-oxoacyl-ACP synthase III family protein [Syntrophales bacterium]
MLYLHGMGHFYPENVITNRFLEELDIGCSEEWVLERVGIRSRQTCLPLDYIKETKNRNPREAMEASLYTNAMTGALAAQMALERAGLKPEDIGMVISGSSVPDNVSPAEATTIAARLGIEAPCFDIDAACTSFGAQINLLSGMKPEALPPFVLLVNPENFTRCVDYSDRRTASLFGDGSTAAIVSTKIPSDKAFTDCSYDSQPSAWAKVSVPRMGYFQQDGNAVQGFAIRKTTESLRALQSISKLNSNRFIFIGHQANLGMLMTVCERCGIPEHCHWSNVADCGNTASAGAPGVLSLHWNELLPGMHIAIVLVGAGLSWVQLLLRVGEEL